MKTKHKSEIGLPKIVTPAERQKAVAALLEKEKEATHARDALAAERRRLPMVRIDKNYVFVAPAGAPLANIQQYRNRMGWSIPWVSSAGNDFNVDFGITTDEGETFGLSVFLRDGDSIIAPTSPPSAASRRLGAFGRSLT
ncbi:MAG: DUF899 family protein [Chthoniobacterales bacterium]